MAQVKKETAKTEQAEETETVEANKAETPAADAVEDFLAELDDVLGTEEEATAMVAGFVQKGGE